METLSKPILLLIFLTSGFIWYKLAKWIAKMDKRNGM